MKRTVHFPGDMAASKWSHSVARDFNALLLKQRIPPASSCTNQLRVRFSPSSTRLRVGCTTRRVAGGRQRTAVPRIIRERALYTHDLSTVHIGVSQSLRLGHEAKPQLDRNVANGGASYPLQSESRDTFTSLSLSGERNAFSFGTVRINTATVAFSAEQKDGMKMEDPRNGATPAQLSFALLKLREELPNMFHPHYYLDTYLYSPDVRLENKLLGFLPSNISGRNSYKAFMWCWKTLLRFNYGFPELQLMKITKELEKGEIHARWRICGYSRSASRNKTTPQVVMEGFSEFAIKPNGLIHVHRLTKVMPAHKVAQRGPLSWLAYLAGLVGLTRQKRLAPV